MIQVGIVGLGDIAPIHQHPQKKIGVCLQDRRNNTTQELPALIRSQSYGKVFGLKGVVTRHRSRADYEAKPWRSQRDKAGDGVMINQTIHPMDLLQLFGGEVRSAGGGRHGHGRLDL